MSESAARILRERLGPPPGRLRTPSPPTIVGDRVERVLRIAADLFAVRAAALVLGDAMDLRVARAWMRDDWREGDALDAARHLFDALAIPSAPASPAVLEDIAPGRGFRAAAPVITPDGRRLGAICLVDPERLALLSGLQRRLLGEFGGLIHWAPEAAPTAGLREAACR